MKEQITPERAEAFEAGIVSTLEMLLAAKGCWGVTLNVDYDPYEPLATIMRDSGIPARIFPPHTWMHVEAGRVSVSMDGTETVELPLLAD